MKTRTTEVNDDRNTTARSNVLRHKGSGWKKHNTACKNALHTPRSGTCLFTKYEKRRWKVAIFVAERTVDRRLVDESGFWFAQNFTFLGVDANVRVKSDAEQGDGDVQPFVETGVWEGFRFQAFFRETLSKKVKSIARAVQTLLTMRKVLHFRFLKIISFWFELFCGLRHIRGGFRLFWLTSSGPGPQPHEGAFCFLKKKLGENQHLFTPWMAF